jgi:hypothetical protein
MVDKDTVREQRRFCNESSDRELNQSIALWQGAADHLPRGSFERGDVLFVLKMLVEERQARADIARLDEDRRRRQQP